jgi:hypothetical protein
MRGMRRPVRVLVAMFLLAFGGLSIHYTGAEDVDHHRGWAREHGMAEPQPAITVVGWIAIGCGVLLGAAALRARKPA